MARATAKHITPTPAVDPVVELSRQLLILWDADEGAQREFTLRDKVAAHVGEDTQVQFGEWRDAVERIISFSQAGGLEGALVQLALTLDILAISFRVSEIRINLISAGRKCSYIV